MGKKKRLRSVVLITAFDANGEVAIDTALPYDAFYEDLHPLIDDDEYRASRGIRRITGKIYNSAGQLQSEFTNEYGVSGELIKGRTAHADGTIIER